ncbi:receptor-transporting protein 3-like isoform X1 [Falco naumanni]|uniref:receptor-transporting protein 3-like isoform X1 n=1 Tax=Falco naumanni TaxID=148594 RepID=UPI001ADE7396|nr:receptor-transporting protein 3-like isoform X1 [Falco naumanni]
MKTWQDIFAAKIADFHLKEPWTLQEDDTLQVHALKPGWKEFVQRRAPGRFQCSQCFHEWSSAKVHILFHMCRCQGWGTVLMRIFRQACRRCPNPRLHEPEFSLEPVEMLLHNLVLKILEYFYHVPIQPSDLLEVMVDVAVAGPHDSTHCEGCQLGVCSKSWPAPASDAREPLMGASKAKTHRTPKCQGTRPDATPSHRPSPSHHPSPFNNSFPWKRCCCCIGSSLFCVLAVLFFILLYFTFK